jgi:hypothetical protein
LISNSIVTHAYRPKRARKRKAQAAAITGPIIVTAKSKRAHRLSDAAPDMTPEEYRRRGDASEALFSEIVRRVREE